MYGSFGVDFIEMHHEEPLSLSRGPTPRRLTDLVPVCSNCHRILHRRRDEVMSTDQAPPAGEVEASPAWIGMADRPRLIATERKRDVCQIWS